MTTEFYKILISNFIFSAILLIALLLLYFIIISRNPINVIILLIFFFFNLSFLFIYCGADYIAVLILLLYAGAISIILLFVVMLLDMKNLILQKEKFSSLFKFIFIFYSIIIFLKIIILFINNINTYIIRVQYVDWMELFYESTNIEVIGTVLYEFYFFQFLIIGVFLFLIMVLIISLIVNFNILSKKQNLSDQLKKKNFITFNE